MTEEKEVKKFESDKIQVRGIIVSNYSSHYSHFDAEMSLDVWLKENNIPGIYGIDTRELTKVLRTTGVMLGKITTEVEEGEFGIIDPNTTNLAGEVCIDKPTIYKPLNKAKKKILLITKNMRNAYR